MTNNLGRLWAIKVSTIITARESTGRLSSGYCKCPQ